MIHKSFNCNLNQLTSFSRGDLSDANSDGLLDTVASPSRTQAWNLDTLGNWSTFTTNSTGQSRSHNAQNQLTAVGSTTLSYDANGNRNTTGYTVGTDGTLSASQNARL